MSHERLCYRVLLNDDSDCHVLRLLKVDRTCTEHLFNDELGAHYQN